MNRELFLCNYGLNPDSHAHQFAGPYNFAGQQSLLESQFHFELMWLEEKKFPEIIKQWWKGFRVVGWAGSKLAIKIKLLKGKITEWFNNSFGRWVRLRKASLKNSILG